MTSAQAVDVIRQALMMAFWLSLPLLAVGFAAGVLMSLFQILTSIQDPAVGAIPRLAAFLAGFLIFLPWMLLRLVGYTESILGNLGRYAR
jgi:flagellar biosynthetic protein FliQ